MTPSPSSISPTLEPQNVADGRSAYSYPDTGLPTPKLVITEPSVTAEPAEKEIAKPIAQDPPKVTEQPKRAALLAWQTPESLLSTLDVLATHPATRAWANETGRLIEKLGPAISKGSKDANEILEQLERSVAKAASLAASIKDRNLSRDVARAGHALDRRLVIWKQIEEMGGIAADLPAPAVDLKSMSDCVAQIETLTKDSDEGKAWRKFLLFDSLREWSNRRHSNKERLPRELSGQLLKRLNQMPMTPGQREFLTSGPLATLHTEVLRHAAQSMDPAQLLKHLERYERTGLPSDARVLANDCRYLNVASAKECQQLARRIEMHYRNANVRVAVSEDLMNRLIPKRDPEYAPVNDHVLGIPVHGQSLTASDLAIRMLPDPTRVRLALEVTGEVASLDILVGRPRNVCQRQRRDVHGSEADRSRSARYSPVADPGRRIQQDAIATDSHRLRPRPVGRIVRARRGPIAT